MHFELIYLIKNFKTVLVCSIDKEPDLGFL